MKEKESLLSNIAWVYSEKLATIATFLIVTSLVARHYGPNIFGIYAYASTIVGLLIAFVGLGSKQIVLREIALKGESKGKVLSNALFLYILSGLALYLALDLWGLYAFREQRLLYSTMAILGSALVFNFIEVFEAYCVAITKRGLISVTLVTVLVAKGILKLFAIHQHMSILAISLVDAISSAALALIVFRRLAPLLDLRLKHIDLSTCLRFVNSGYPYIFSAAMIAFNAKLAALIIGLLMDDEAVGIYSIPSNIVAFLPPILIGFENTLLPRNIAKYTKNNAPVSDCLSGIKRTYCVSFVVSGLFFAAALLLAPLIIKLLYGSGYDQSIILLQILAFLPVLSSLTRCQSQLAQIRGNHRSIAYRQALLVVMNIVFNFTLIPLYGTIGAAFATVIAFAASLFIFSLIDKEFGDLVGSILLKPDLSYFVAAASNSPLISWVAHRSR